MTPPISDELNLGGFRDLEARFAASVSARAVSQNYLDSLRQHAGPYAERHGYAIDGTV